ncbi:MAG: oxidoreductase [Cyclobacteriaceae bacterium]|nr:oxidoreductase [Cyclobacteriaceae bacterium]MCH8514725.1 oxidoreductase [Cyclobacteriaceae bacterium]
MGKERKKSSAMIVGATGLIGNNLLHQLLKDSSYDKVIAVVRTKIDLEHPKLLQYVLDFEQLEEVGVLLAADHVYCCLGTTIGKAGSKAAFRKVDYEYVLAFAQQCLANKCQIFTLVSSMGSDVNSSVFYSRTKGEIEKALSDLKFPKLIIVRPALLLGDRSEKRFGEDLFKKVSLAMPFLYFGPFKKYKPIHAEIVAQAMYKLSQKKEDHKVAIYENLELFEMAEF